MPKKKTTKESDKALLDRITREMAKPRVAESAQAEGRNRYRLAHAKQLNAGLTTPDNTGKDGKRYTRLSRHTQARGVAI